MTTSCSLFDRDDDNFDAESSAIFNRFLNDFGLLSSVLHLWLNPEKNLPTDTLKIQLSDAKPSSLRTTECGNFINVLREKTFQVPCTLHTLIPSFQINGCNVGHDSVVRIPHVNDIECAGRILPQFRLQRFST